MIPILFSRTDTVFTSNGVGRLSDAISCTVEEERNGKYELSLEYPMNGAHYADLVEGAIIVARHADTIDVQPFRIYKITRPLAGVVTVYARHISYDLNKIVVLPFEEPSLTQLFLNLPTHAANTCPFTFETDKVVNTPFAVDVPSSVRSLLGGSEGSILDVYGGEYEFNGYRVILHNSRGTDNGVTIRYGKNLTELTQEGDSSGNVTAVLPYWTGADTDGEETTVYAQTPVYSGVGYLERYEDSRGEIYANGAGDVYDGVITPDIVEPLDLSEAFEDAPTVEQLNAAAAEWLEAHASVNPEENIRVSFVQLWQTNEYQDFAPLQRVGLCDTVTVEYARLGVKATTKVIRTVYNTLLERYDLMELGAARSTLADTIANAEKVADGIGAEVNKAVQSAKTAMQAAIEAATDLLAGGLGGHVVINRNADGEPNEILIMDTDSVSSAMNVIRMNMNGIGFSTTGYNGPFTTAWTIDGRFNASFIATGILSAILIEGPTSDTFWDLATGIFQNFGQSTVTAQVETAEGVYTPTQYTVQHKTRIAQGLLSLLGKVGNGAELPFMTLGLAALGMSYEFYEGIAGSGESTSYPYAGLGLFGDTVTGKSGSNLEYDGRTATYNPAAHYTPDYLEIGGAENLSTGSNQYPDRNRLRLQAGWGNYENSILFKSFYKWEETPSGVRRQFSSGINRRPCWEYAVDDNVEYPNTDNSRIICAGYLTDDRTTIRFQIPLARPFHPDVASVEIYGEFKVRRNGGYILGGASTTVDFSDYDLIVTPNASGLAVRLKRPNNATFSNNYNNYLMAVDIYGLGILCFGS